MLDENVQMTDLDAQHWKNLIQLFSGRPKPPKPDILFLMVDGDRCLKALHNKKGALRNFDYGEKDLALIAEREKVAYVTRFNRDFLPGAFAAAEANFDLDANYAMQMMTLYNQAIAFTAVNMEWYPERYNKRRPLNYKRGQKNLNRIIPDNHCFFLCVLEDGLPHSSLIIGKANGKINLLTTLDAFGLAHEAFDPKTDLEQVEGLIKEHFNPVHLSFVIERKVFESMLASKQPVSTLCQAIEEQRALFSPFRFRLRLLLWLARKFKKL